jgi:hypothetical protein
MAMECTAFGARFASAEGRLEPRVAIGGPAPKWYNKKAGSRRPGDRAEAPKEIHP